jgi:quercetin dioxygenase-like cupin family protein
MRGPAHETVRLRGPKGGPGRIVRSRRAVVVGAGIVTAALVAASVAFANHRSATGLLFDGATANSVNFNQGQGPIKMRLQGPIRVRQAHVVLGGAFVSGWHTHPGPEILAVVHGAITMTEADCEPVTIGAGQAYVVSPDSPINVTIDAGTDLTTTFLLPMPPEPGTPGIPTTPVDSPC